jgi:hypothetical protein
VKSLALVLALAALAGCSKKKQPKKEPPVAGMSETEIKRGEDACKLYVEKICACATQKPDLAQQCELAKSLPNAMQIALSVAINPETKPDIAKQSYDGMRATIATCIQETAKLPSLGCN